MKNRLLFLFIVVIFSSTAYSQSHWLDTTFANKGLFHLDSMYTNAMLVQHDGKIVMGGSHYINYFNFGLTRLNADGSLDSSFGSNGFVFPINQNITDLHSQWAQINNLAQQTDGKIVVAGIAGGYGVTFDAVPYLTCLARYNTNGSIDSSFGLNGFVIDYFDSVWGGQNCQVMVDNSGRIFLTNIEGVLNYYSGSYSGYRTYCYDSVGHLDTTFGASGGIYTTQGLVPHIFSASLQPDRKLLFCGSDSSKSVFSLVRYTTSGQLDSTFGVNGVAGISCNSNDFGAFNAICVQSDGKILASKYLYATDTGYFKISRFTSTGVIDNTFGQSGCVQTLASIPNVHIDNTNASFITQYPNGNILVGTSSLLDSVNRIKGCFAFARYLPNGDIDSTFGEQGILNDKIQVYYGGNFPVLNGLSLLNDNKFVVSSGNQVSRYLAAAINTGVSSIDASTFSVYPNPAASKLYLSSLPQSAKITITDMTGRTMAVTAHEGEVDISALSSGIYCIHIQLGAEFIANRFVKQ